MEKSKTVNNNFIQIFLRYKNQKILSSITVFLCLSSQHRNNLETKSIDSGNLDDSVELIDTIEAVRQTQIEDEIKIKQLLEAQRLLERQRYSFPDNWTSVDTIQNSWTSMNDILKQKEQVIDTKVCYFDLFYF